MNLLIVFAHQDLLGNRSKRNDSHARLAESDKVEIFMQEKTLDLRLPELKAFVAE